MVSRLQHLQKEAIIGLFGITTGREVFIFFLSCVFITLVAYSAWMAIVCDKLIDLGDDNEESCLNPDIPNPTTACLQTSISQTGAPIPGCKRNPHAGPGLPPCVFNDTICGANRSLVETLRIMVITVLSVSIFVILYFLTAWEECRKFIKLGAPYISPIAFIVILSLLLAWFPVCDQTGSAGAPQITTTTKSEEYGLRTGIIIVLTFTCVYLCIGLVYLFK